MSYTQIGPNFQHHLTFFLHEIFNLEVFQKLETTLWQVVVVFYYLASLFSLSLIRCFSNDVWHSNNDLEGLFDKFQWFWSDLGHTTIWSHIVFFPSNCLFSRVFLLVVLFFCACFVVVAFGTCSFLQFSMDSTLEMSEKINKIHGITTTNVVPSQKIEMTTTHKGKSRQPSTRGYHQVRFGEGRCMQPYPHKQTGYFHHLSPWPPNTRQQFTIVPSLALA